MPSERPTKKQTTRLIAYLFLLTLGIFAALKIHSCQDRKEAYQAVKISKSTTSPKFGEDSELDEIIVTNRPSEQSFTQSAGLSPISQDVAGIAPPIGSKRRFAFSRDINDINEKHARYDYTGELPAVVQFYRNALKEAKFDTLKDEKTSQGEYVILANRANEKIVLVMRENKANNKIVEISVTLIVPTTDWEPLRDN